MIWFYTLQQSVTRNYKIYLHHQIFSSTKILPCNYLVNPCVYHNVLCVFVWISAIAILLYLYVVLFLCWQILHYGWQCSACILPVDFQFLHMRPSNPRLPLILVQNKDKNLRNKPGSTYFCKIGSNVSAFLAITGYIQKIRSSNISTKHLPIDNSMWIRSLVLVSNGSQKKTYRQKNLL